MKSACERCKGDRWVARLVVILFVFALSRSVPGADQDQQTWTLEFNNLRVSDILNELSRVSGIDIFSNRLPEDKIVNKCYTNQTLDQIVRDVLKGSNFALVWHHGEGGLESLDIWVFDGGGQGPSRGFSVIEREIPDLRSRFQQRTGRLPGSDEENEEPEEADEETDEEETPRRGRIVPPQPREGEGSEGEPSEPEGATPEESTEGAGEGTSPPGQETGEGGPEGIGSGE